MKYRYTKIGPNSYLKELCKPLTNHDSNLEYGGAVKSSDETPLELPKMNFSGQADAAKADVSDTNEKPLGLPKVIG